MSSSNQELPFKTHDSKRLDFRELAACHAPTRQDAFGGASWGAAGTVQQLMATGAVPPLLV